MGVLAVHLVLHWKWIVCVLRGKPHPDVSGGRFALGVAGLVLVALLAAAPLLTPAQTAPRSELLENSSGNQQTDLGGANEGVDSSDSETIRGFMTLEDVASQSGIPVSEILRRLALPPDTASSEQVGRLLRANGMDMSDLRKAVVQNDPAQ